MRLDAPLDDILATGSHVRILRALFAVPPGIGRSGRDLARRAGISHPRASQVLGSLAEQGLVSAERAPRADLYRLNREHVLVGPLGELFEQESKTKFDLLSLVAKELKSRHLPVMEARIFGSAARGDMTGASDVDLALVTSAANVQLVEDAAQDIAAKARELFGTHLNVLVGPKSKQGAWVAIESEGVDLFMAAKTAM